MRIKTPGVGGWEMVSESRLPPWLVVCMRENDFLRGRSEGGKGLVIASFDKQDK